MTKLYRPGNGTEGCMFIEQWCDNCEKDREYRETEANSCPIVAASLAWDITDPRYPKEWCWQDGKAVCTAYEREHVGGPDPIPVTPRCTRTGDMFK